MNIQLLSDLHLESNPHFVPQPAPGADVLVLAGDIGSYQTDSSLTRLGIADFGLGRFADDKWANWNHAKGLGAPYEKVKNDISYKDDPGQVSSHHAQQKVEMGLTGINVAYNPNYIISLVVDAQGVVWTGTWGGGLSRFDGKTWTHFTTSEGLPGNHVFMLNIDAKKTLWVGTNNGLASLREGKFKTLNTHDGLFANNVFSMVTGQDGSLWVGSYGGVAHIAKSD